MESTERNRLKTWRVLIGAIAFHLLALSVLFAAIYQSRYFGMIVYPVIWVLGFTVFGVYFGKRIYETREAARRWRLTYLGSVLLWIAPIEIIVVIGGFYDESSFGLWVLACYVAGYILNPLPFLGNLALGNAFWHFHNPTQ